MGGAACMGEGEGKGVDGDNRATPHKTKLQHANATLPSHLTGHHPSATLDPTRPRPSRAFCAWARPIGAAPPPPPNARKLPLVFGARERELDNKGGGGVCPIQRLTE